MFETWSRESWKVIGSQCLSGESANDKCRRMNEVCGMWFEEGERERVGRVMHPVRVV